MKNLLFALLFLVLVVPNMFSQASAADIENLKSSFAASAGIKVSDIKSAELKSFGDKHFGYFKYVKDGKSNTTAQAFALGGPGGATSIGGSITCTGVLCSECDIIGLPNIMDAYCDCTRQVKGEGYCNMTKSIGL